MRFCRLTAVKNLDIVGYSVSSQSPLVPQAVTSCLAEYLNSDAWCHSKHLGKVRKFPLSQYIIHILMGFAAMCLCDEMFRMRAWRTASVSLIPSQDNYIFDILQGRIQQYQKFICRHVLHDSIIMEMVTVELRLEIMDHTDRHDSNHFRVKWTKTDKITIPRNKSSITVMIRTTQVPRE